jgi:UDP-N-acetylmuramoylalanine--D-glutamate ligase
MTHLDQFNSWHSNWSELKVAVIGLGVTGFSVADTLAELKAQILVVAQKAEPEYLDILDVLGVSYKTGEDARNPQVLLQEFSPDVVITSPGVPPQAEVIVWAEQNGVPVWVDVDLAWRLRDKTSRVAKWITITGTNGKTTTTGLVTEMLNSGSSRAAACGNIGTPILDCIREPEGFDFLIVELSSFQLHYLGDISPLASALLNIEHDHIDWHGSFDEYARTKGKIYRNTQAAAVFNPADSKTRALLEQADVVEGCRAIGFTIGVPGPSEVGFAEDVLCDRAFLDNRFNEAIELATLEDLQEIGVVTPHLMANVAASSALARAAGAEPKDIRAGIRSFRLDAHRIELVAVSNEVAWVDDSKATNPHATSASLSSFDSVVWIVGGLLKGVDLGPLVEEHASRLKGAIVIGVDREPVLEALRRFAPKVPVVEVSSEDVSQVMPQAVSAAANLASAGDVVVLAPSSASMDQFKDYADRGRQFAAAVRDHLGAN